MSTISTSTSPIFPIWLRGLLAASILSSVIATGWFTKNSTPISNPNEIQRGDIVASRGLYFHNSSDGDIIVQDANDRTSLALLKTDENSFMRSVTRSLILQRKASGFDNSIPFELTSWESGYLSLKDPSTGRLIELSAFGRERSTIFQKLLTQSTTLNN